MRDERGRSDATSRRRFLAASAATAGMMAAGCLGSGPSSSDNGKIEPEEPSVPREGSPGEFYYFLEENGITVEVLERDDKKLYLTYRSTAKTVDESNQEITIIYQVYKQALIERGSPIEFLYTEISNPFDGQAHGWGISTEWIRQYDSDDTAENESTVADSNETTKNGTDGNNSTSTAVDMDQFTLWNNIMNSKVYEEDIKSNESNQSH